MPSSPDVEQATEIRIAQQISYHPDGQIKAWLDGAGQTHKNTRDLDGAPNGFRLGDSAWLFALDVAKRRIATQNALEPSEQATYAYDAQGRIISAKLPSAEISYVYDANGNRIQQVNGLSGLNTSSSSSGLTPTGQSTVTYSIEPASNRLRMVRSVSGIGSGTGGGTSGTISGNNTRSLAYDPVGNLLYDNQPGKMNALRYNAAGRVIQSQTPNGVTAYRYNGLGERISKRRLSGIGINNTNRETHYFYDPAGRLISESDATGRVTRTYVWLNDTPMAMMDSGSNSTVNSANVSANGADKLYYLHTDPLNTPRLVTNEKNETVWRWNPIGEPFGAEYPEEGKIADGQTSGQTTNERFIFNLRFPGQYYDAETGSHYNYYRDHYFPELGRYGQSDPIGLAGGLNTYAYVEGNPLMFVDPSGLQAKGGRGGKGERGYAGGAGGTSNPGKHWRDDPAKPGWGWEKDPQTGKPKYKRRPPHIPVPEGENESKKSYCQENQKTCAVIGGAIICGLIITPWPDDILIPGVAAAAGIATQ